MAGNVSRPEDLRAASWPAAGADGSLGEDHTPETHLIPVLLLAALGRREKVTVFGTDYPTPDGTCIRDYVHVEDLARAHLTALDRRAKATGGYNLGIGRGFSNREVIEAARRVTAPPGPGCCASSCTRTVTGAASGVAWALVRSHNRSRSALPRDLARGQGKIQGRSSRQKPGAPGLPPSGSTRPRGTTSPSIPTQTTRASPPKAPKPPR